MKKALKLSSMTLAVMVFAAIAPMSATADLIVNGSFEDGVSIPAGFVTVAGGDTTSITGWEVLGGGTAIDYIGSFWLASDGVRSLDLDGSPGPGGIQQTFGTEVGKAYKVDFDMAGNSARAPYVKWMQVAALGAGPAPLNTKVFSFDSTASTVNAMGWAPMEFAFIANSASTTLRFSSMTPAAATDWEKYCGPALDNVVVTPVPGAILLGAMGLCSSGGVLAWRKRRTA